MDWSQIDVLCAIREHFPGWWMISEVPTLEPTLIGDRPKGSRVIDALLFNQSDGQRIAVEVKTSRVDLLRELQTPEKREAWRPFAHAFVYAVPEAVDVDLGEIPEGLGWISVDRAADESSGRRYAIRWRQRPIHACKARELPIWFNRFLLQRLSAAENNANKEDRMGAMLEAAMRRAMADRAG